MHPSERGILGPGKWGWRTFKTTDAGPGIRHAYDTYTGMKYRTFCGKWFRRDRIIFLGDGPKCEKCEELLKSRRVAEIIGGGK